MRQGHIQKRGAKSWRLKFDAGVDPETKKRKTQYVTVKGTKRDAQRELNRLLHELDEGSYIEPSKITVGEHLEQWLDVVEHGLARQTFERYRAIVRGHLVPALGSTLLVNLTAPRVERYYAEARKDGHLGREGGLSERTLLHHHRILRKAIRKAVGVTLVRDPMVHVTAPKPSKSKIQYLKEPGDLATLIKAAKGTRMYTPTLLAATTGLRRGEVLALRWSDVDLDAQPAATVTVNQALEDTKKNGLQFKAPKSEHSRRTVTLPALTVDALRAHKIAQAEERVRLGLGKSNHDLVFASPVGGIIRPRNFTKEFGRIVKRAGVPRITFHGLRHTHFTDLMRKGVNSKIVSHRAGHASVSITLDIYCHVDAGMQAAVAEQVDASLGTLLEH